MMNGVIEIAAGFAAVAGQGLDLADGRGGAVCLIAQSHFQAVQEAEATPQLGEGADAGDFGGRGGVEATLEFFECGRGRLGAEAVF
jgi:hypothetical protein